MRCPSILYVIQGFPSAARGASSLGLGGAELQAQRVAHLLFPEFGVRVLTHRGPSQPAKEDVDGVKVCRIRLSIHGGKRGALAILARLILSGLRLPASDIVQGFQLNALTLAAATIAAVHRSRYVIKITGRGNFERLRGRRGQMQLRLLAWMASAVVVPSWSCARAAQTAGVPRHKIRHIPNGVDTAHFQPPTAETRASWRAQLGYGPQDFVFCWIGRLDHLKGLDCVPPAWALIHEQCPEARLLIVGDGAEEAVAQSLVAAFPDSVCHLHHQEDVRPFYACADAVLLTSRSEGLSNVLLEGLACGLLAVVSSVPENTEVGAGQDFLLSFARESPRSLADALATAIGRRHRRVELGQLARRHVEKNYSLSSTAARWADLYRTLLGHRLNQEAVPPPTSAAEPLLPRKG